MHVYTKDRTMKISKNINVTFLVTVALIIGASYYVVKYIIPEDTFKLDDSYQVTIITLGNKDDLEVQVGPKTPVEIRNDVDEQLKVCTYKHNDALQAVPLKCWTFSKGSTMKWDNAPSLFTLRVFKPALLDDPIITESDVEHLSKITISKK